MITHSFAAVLDFFTGCGDVFTKPKLEKHRAVCRASFDCIDCSTRFETPADYNGHTSCISEAQKHQKALYNGGVSGCTIRNTSFTLTNYRNKLAPKGMVETNGRGRRVEESNEGITDNDGNSKT